MHEQHRATARVLDLLEYLAASGGDGYTLTELAQVLEAPKSSLFPILHTLAHRNYIHLERGTGRYSIGISSYVLGTAYTSGRNALDLILKVMEQVVEGCEEPCQLAVLDQRNALYIGKVDSSQAIRMISHVGARLPANSTALGKALLSGLHDEDVRALFAEGLPKLTKHTITEIDVLLEQLGEVRKYGIAWEQEESNDHLCCCALPLCQKGVVFAAISVSMPLFRRTPEKQELVCRCLRSAKADIERIAEERDFKLEIS